MSSPKEPGDLPPSQSKRHAGRAESLNQAGFLQADTKRRQAQLGILQGIQDSIRSSRPNELF